MISDVREPAFNPMLAPYYLKGLLPWEHCFPFGADFYRRHDVICHFGSPVAALNAIEKTVQTEAGFKLQWDQCLVATGANAAIPPVPGLEASPFAYPLRTSASTRQLESVLARADKAVVMGASLVGIKIAESLAHKKARVMVADVAGQVMPRGAHPKQPHTCRPILSNTALSSFWGVRWKAWKIKKTVAAAFLRHCSPAHQSVF